MANSLGSFFVSIGLDAGVYVEGLTKAEYKTKRASMQMERDISRLADGFGAASKAAGAFAGVLSSGFAFQQFIQAADAVTQLNNKLVLATGSQMSAAAAQADLFDIAQKSRVGWTDLGGTYAQIARASGELGLSQQDLLTVTQAIANSLAITAGPAESMNAALFQLSQGMASGVLRGEELNSVMEQTPRLAKALADGLGVPIGRLREMGQAGELTADRVVAALKSQADVLSGEVQTATVTVSQSMTLLSNAATKAVGDVDKAIGVSSRWASLLQGASNDITVFSLAIQESAQRGDSGFTQIANGIGTLIGRAGFGSLEIAASLTNKAINLLTADIFELDEAVRLMPANLRGTDAALKQIELNLKDAGAEYDRLQERLKKAPENIYIKSELANLSRYIDQLKEARAQKMALTGDLSGPVEYGNEGRREATRQAERKRDEERAKAQAEFQKQFATQQQKADAAVDEWRKKLGSAFTVDTEKTIRAQFTPKSSGGKSTRTTDPEAEAKRYLESLKQQLQATRDLSVEEKLLADIQAGRLGKVSAEQLKSLQDTARQIDEAKAFIEIEKEFERARMDTARATARAREEEDQFIKALIDATPEGQMKRRTAEAERLEKAFQDGRISAEQLMDVYDMWDEQNSKVKEANDNAKAFGDIMGSAFEDAIIEGKKFGDVLKGLAQDILKVFLRRQVTEPLAQAASGALGGLFSAGGGSFSDALSNLFSFEGGGWTGDGSRSGGLDGKGGYLAMVHPKERIIDTTKGGAGGGTTIVQNVTIDARGADASVEQKIIAAMRQTKQETLAAVQLQANRGGSFASAVGRA